MTQAPADQRHGHRFDPSILREYDIRGVVGETLGPDDARAVGRCFGTILHQALLAQPPSHLSHPPRPRPRIAVGRDGRVSSPMLEAALVEGLQDSGVDVVRVGMGPTPLLYYAEASQDDVQGGIQVTGSHNPAHHNGFKLVLQGRPFFGDDIRQLAALAEAGGPWCAGPEFSGPDRGTVADRDLTDAYIDRLLDGLDGVDPAGLAGLRIGWDTGNGAGGPAVERLTARLPGEHHLLFTPVDGTFPNHHPDPTVEANLADLRALVAAKRLDFGLAFDGDADRIGVVDSLGRVIWGDQLLMIYAEDLLRDRPGATIIADVKASGALFDRIAALGGVPLMWKTGHSLIKAKMKATGAPLGGEMTGHVFFADRFYGYDDALYAAVRLMAATVRLGRSVTDLRTAMPAMINTPELRFPVPAARKFAAVAEVHGRLAAAGARVNAIDGVRVDTADGWWLLRASNTQDVLVARAESCSEAGLDRLLAEIDTQLAASGLQRGG